MAEKRIFPFSIIISLVLGLFFFGCKKDSLQDIEKTFLSYRNTSQHNVVLSGSFECSSWKQFQDFSLSIESGDVQGLIIVGLDRFVDFEMTFEDGRKLTYSEDDRESPMKLQSYKVLRDSLTQAIMGYQYYITDDHFQMAY